MLGIRWGLALRLLAPTLLLLVLGIGAVEIWTSHVSRETVRQEVEHELFGDLRVLKAYLSPLGTKWSVYDGELRLGYESLAGQDDIVDAATEASHGVATIFAGDRRVATSVRKLDGTRGVGTRLENPIVRQLVLKEGKTFHGVAEVLGRRYLAIYEPIRNDDDKVIGMLFVGEPIETLDAPERAILRGSLAAGTIAILCFGAIMVWAIRWILSPLLRLANTTIDLAAGNLDAALPGIDRSDEIGRVAQAIEVFRKAAVHKAILETAKASAAAEQSFVVTVVASGLERLAAGDVTARLDETFSAEYQSLKHNFNAASASLEMLVQGIYDSSSRIASGVAEVAQAAGDLNRRTETQAATIEQTAVALDQITATVVQTAASASDVHQVVSRLAVGAKGSDTVMRQMAEAMGGISSCSCEIGQIVAVIKGIAAQSHLLSLNAGIEAARAGDVGRGFSVVAGEVRALAARTAMAASEIQAHAGASGQHVGSGVAVVERTGRTFDDIVAKVAVVGELVSEITAAAAEQAAGLAQVNRAVNQVDHVTQQNAAMVEQTSAACDGLTREAAELVKLTQRFRVGRAA